jgi:hypothetical protein
MLDKALKKIGYQSQSKHQPKSGEGKSRETWVQLHRSALLQAWWWN